MTSGNKSLICKIPAREWRGLVPEMQGGRLRVGMTCHICGTTDHWTAAQLVGPQTAIPKVIHMGWSVDRKLTCPACIEAKRKVVPMKLVTPVAEAAPVDLGQMKKNKRLVIAALEDYFDEASRRYREGKSDKDISEELGLSEKFVSTVREEFFGSIAEPEDIATFRAQLDAAKQLVADLDRQLVGLCQRNGWRV